MTDLSLSQALAWQESPPSLTVVLKKIHIYLLISSTGAHQIASLFDIFKIISVHSPFFFFIIPERNFLHMKQPPLILFFVSVTFPALGTSGK